METSMQDEITLSVRGLRKKIGGKEIIRGIDFELRRGEVFGFLGPNGSGKTTTIRMLVGLIRPTAGTVEVCGYHLHRQFQKAIANLGCIVENPELYAYLSGWDNLEYFARMMPGVDTKRIQEVVDLVGMNARIHDKVKTYSLGMRQRLGIAQALLGRPRVLILDEPTNGLDPAGIKELRAFIRLLAENEGLTVFVSSHLLSEIQLMCDRVAVISKGSLLQVTEVKSLLARNERAYWRVDPVAAARLILSNLTYEISEENGYLVTPYDETRIAEWHRLLVEGGVQIFELTRKMATLEDLFLEMTGGESID